MIIISGNKFQNVIKTLWIMRLKLHITCEYVQPRNEKSTAENKHN